MLFNRLHRGLALRFLFLLTAVGFVGASVATDAKAAAVQAPGTKETHFVDVIEVSGLIDPAVKKFILNSLDKAVTDKAEALVIQLDSGGSILSQNQLDDLENKLRADHRVPVAVWVGGGAAPHAYGGAARIMAAADIVGLGRLAKVGKSTPSAQAGDPLVGKSMDFQQAATAKVFSIDAPVLPEFVGRLDGLTIDGKVLDTATDVKTTDGHQNKTLRGVRFEKMNVLQRLYHLGSNPVVAYFMLVIALSLFVFEFFTGGIGIAAGVGVMAFVLAASGLGALPTRPVSVLLIVLAMCGFAIDIQAGTPRFWTGFGTVGLVIGSVFLYHPPASLPWFAIALMSVLVVLFMVNGMPTMVRTRFATPTIGRESMIGEIGTAASAVSPDGIVTVLGAPWRARTNRATPIVAGDQVRVVAIDGLMLEVEPLEGAAKDAGH